MRLVVLLSCMNKKDIGIISESNIQSDIIIVNQCDHNSVEEFTFEDVNSKRHKCIFYSTTSRGLSKSRNIALNLAINERYDIALLCDDDEYLTLGYSSAVCNAYAENKHVDIIVFSIDWKERHKPSPKQKQKMGLIEILRTSSQQISFKVESILNADIFFDEKMGSGTGNGGGEEIKFLLDSYRKRLHLLQHPYEVAKINPGSKSQWFKGFTSEYLENLAWSNRRAMGDVLGYAYIWWYCFSHLELYRRNFTIFTMLKVVHKGFFSKR